MRIQFVLSNFHTVFNFEKEFSLAFLKFDQINIPKTVFTTEMKIK